MSRFNRKKFTKLREATGYSASAFALKLGFSRTVVWSWECGTHQPRLTIPQIKQLCEELGCKLEDLLSEDE